MKINKDAKILVLRFNNYKKYKFIDEHSKILESNKSVWLLKGGKAINSKTMDNILSEGGHIILKEPKKDGGKYYYVHAREFYNGKNKETFAFPCYYNEMIDDYNCIYMEKLEGTWINIDFIKEFNGVKNLKLISNGKNVEDIIASTRSSLIYAQSNLELVI